MHWYSWLTSHYHSLVNQYRTSYSHHGLLLSSIPGNGLELLVFALGRWLMCQQKQDDKPCNQCHHCRLMRHHQHPDWHELCIEKGKKQIGIEQVRQLLDKLQKYSQQDGTKIIWIPEANNLSIAAANALLKTLEEPTNDTFFLLGCRSVSELLLTIRSRCRHYHLPPPKREEGIAWLQKQTETTTHPRYVFETVLGLVQGAPLAAKNLLLNDSWKSRSHFLHSFKQALTAWNWLLLLSVLTQDHTLDKLYWLSTLLHDGNKCQLGMSVTIVNQDQQALVATIAAHIDPRSLHQMIKIGWRCYAELQANTNLNIELLLADTLCQWNQLGPIRR